MQYKVHSFRHSGVILAEDQFVNQINEILEIIDSITDQDLIEKHESYGLTDRSKMPKSLSVTINELLKERFIQYKWHPESNIFQDSEYQGENWRLDFAKQDISVEVAFNHSSVIAWNLIKPVLASELNHVQKAIQTQVGVIITATQNLKSAGGFDSAIGTYEKFLDYLPPLRNMLTVPLFIIGLEAPETFKISHEQFDPRKKIGNVKRI